MPSGAFTPGPTPPPDPVWRDAVGDLFGKFNEKLDRLVDKVETRLDSFGRDMTDMRDRLIRMEAQDYPSRLAKLEDGNHDAGARLDRLERNLTVECQKIVADASASKVGLERRLTRMEMIIAPLSIGGSALLTAVVGSVVAALSGHLH